MLYVYPLGGFSDAPQHSLAADKGGEWQRVGRKGERGEKRAKGKERWRGERGAS